MKKQFLILSFCVLSIAVFGQKSTQNIMPESITYKVIDTIQLDLKVYRPTDFDASKTYNCMVFYHGGGWNGGNYKAFQRQSQYLASRGMIAISVVYRIKNVHGTTPFEAANDAKSAMRYVRKHAKELSINPHMIASGGGSAGGHLAAVCGNIKGLNDANDDLSVNPVPNALVLFNPVYDNSKNGYGYRAIEGRVDEISPLHNITKGAPPTIVFFGTKDKTTSVASSKEYEKKMKEVGSRIDLHLYEGQPHSFFNKGAYFIDTVKKMDAFLVSLGYLKGKGNVDTFFEL